MAAIIGFPSSKAGLGAVVSNVMAREKEIRSIEIKKRRLLISELSQEYLSHAALAQFEALTRKELNKCSKEFRYIHQVIKPLNLHRMATTGKGISVESVRKVSVHLNAMTQHRTFIEMDLEDSTSDYFKLTLALYIATKAIGEYILKANFGLKAREQFVFVSSEIGIRLYSMYVDRRMDM